LASRIIGFQEMPVVGFIIVLKLGPNTSYLTTATGTDSGREVAYR
jgi:hypothetical protein